MRLVSSALLVILGPVIAVRALLAAAPAVVILGIVLLLLGAYRIQQYRRARGAG